MKRTRTLRWRLTLFLVIGVSSLWLLLASVLLWGVRNQVEHTLDSRLAASAQMVASLLERSPRAQGASSESPQAGRLPDGAAQPAFPSTLACRVTAVNGDVIAQSPNTPESALDAAPVGYSMQQADGERWRVYRHRHDGLDITTAERISTRDNLMNAIVVAAALPFALALAGTLAIVWFGIVRSLAPLRQLGAHIAERDHQLLQPLIWDEMPAEIRPLLDEINRLLGRVDQAMQRERRFSGDAAHELRTPLTAIHTHLQVARITGIEHADHALDQATRAVERMRSTLEQLLLLARIDSNDAFEDAARASGPEIIESARQDLPPRAGQGDIQVQLPPGPAPLIAAPAVLVTAALRNLLDNALRFSPGDMPVELSLAHEPESVVFVVRDYGPGVLGGEIDRMTHRFVTSGPASGSGLGLAIAETIAARFGGTLTLRNVEPGLEAMLRLPRQ